MRCVFEFLTEFRCLGRHVKFYGGGAYSSENLAKEIVVMTTMTILQEMYDVSALKILWSRSCNATQICVERSLSRCKMNS